MEKTAVSQCQAGLTRKRRVVFLMPTSVAWKSGGLDSNNSLHLLFRLFLAGRFSLPVVRALGEVAPKMSLSQDSVEIRLLYSTQKTSILCRMHGETDLTTFIITRNQPYIFQAGETFSEPALFRKAFINFWVWTYTYILTYTVYIQHTAGGRKTAPLGMYKTL